MPIRSPQRAGLLLLFLCSAPAVADEAAPAPPCAGADSAKVRALAGDWDAVVNDKVIGRDALNPRLKDCVLEEQWAGARGMHGTSLTAFDAAAARWRQFWVDDSGTVAHLEGAFDGDALVLEGDSNQADGKRKHVRGTWRPLDCDAAKGRCVHVLWESQEAQGKAWAAMYEFDLRPHE